MLIAIARQTAAIVTFAAMLYCLSFHDAAGRVTDVTPPAGHSGGTLQTSWKTQLIYNSNDELIRRQSAEPSAGIARNQVDYIYDANGNVTSTKVLNLNETGAAYPNGELVSTFAYDTLNRPIEVVSEVDGATSVTSRTAYNRNGLPIKVLSPLAAAGADPANTEVLSYDERDLLYRSVRGNGSPTPITAQFDYDANGNLVTTTAGMEESVTTNRRVTTCVYDLFDRLLTLTDPLLNKTDYDYDGAGHVVTTKAYQGASTVLAQADYTYDLSGRNTVIAGQLLDETGAAISGTVNGVNTGDGVSTTAMAYSAASQVKTVTFEANPPAQYTYDGMLRVASVTDPKGNVVTYTYDGNSNVTQAASNEIDDTGGPAQQFLTQFSYDQLDRLKTRSERYSTASSGLFNTVAFDYDSRSNLVKQTDARANVSRFVYDGLARQVSSAMEITLGNSANTSTAYDANSRMVSRTDPNGRATQYAYDSLDRATRVTYADGTVQRLAYNRFGNVTDRTDPTGTTFAQTFDKLGRMTGRTTSPVAGFINPGDETFAYDALSRMTSAKAVVPGTTTDVVSEAAYTYDSLGNVRSETLQVGAGPARTVTSISDDNGSRKKTIYPGGRTVTYTHDALKRVLAIADGGGTIANYAYVGGRVARRANGNGTQADYTYDGLGAANGPNDFGVGRVIQTRHTVTSGGAELDKYTFEWDRDGNKTRRVDAHTTGVPGMVDDYTHAYDGLSRMTARTPDSGLADTFLYDATGNRTTTGYTLEGADAKVHAYTKTPADSRGYDRLGNVATYNARERWYTFDAQSRLTSLTEAGSRINDVFAIPGTYRLKRGTWSVTYSVLTESTSATGRILRALPTGTTDIVFSYKSPHDAEDTADYDPERYVLFSVRLFDTGWK